MFTSYGLGQYSSSAGATEGHIWAVPRNYRSDGSKRLIVWCHSAGGVDLEPVIPADNTIPLLQALVDTLGLPLISFDGQVPSGGLAQHWGNDTAQSRCTDAINYAHAQLNAKIDEVIMVGVSMGGMLALNYARANPTKIAALALLYPATSLQAIHDGTGGAGNAATSTESAYGGSLAAFNAAVAAHDPSQHASSIAALGIPMKMWYSDSDTTVGTANQTAFATAVGSPLQRTVLAGAAHADMTKIDPLKLQQFVKGAV